MHANRNEKKWENSHARKHTRAKQTEFKYEKHTYTHTNETGKFPSLKYVSFQYCSVSAAEPPLRVY